MNAHQLNPFVQMLADGHRRAMMGAPDGVSTFQHATPPRDSSEPSLPMVSDPRGRGTLVFAARNPDYHNPPRAAGEPGVTMTAGGTSELATETGWRRMTARMRLGELLARYSFDDTELACMAIAREQEAALVALTKSTDEQAERLEREAAGLKEFARSVTLTVEFDSVAQRDQVKGALVARAKAKGLKAGAVLASILTHDAVEAAAE